MESVSKENDAIDDKNHAKSGSKTMDDRHRMYLTSCLYLVGFLDLFGVGLLVPLLSRHARDLGASPALIGAVGSVYGILQLISGPFLGRLSDTMGRRKILLVCLFMTTIGYTLNAFSTSIALLIFSRVPLGIFKHGIATVKAYLAEITPRQERPRVFGRFSAASSTGFIIGPLFGGYLSETEGGFYRVATCTSIVFALNFLFAYFLVHPKSRNSLEKTQSVAAFTKEEYSIETNFFQSFKSILRSSGDLLFLQLLLSSAVSIYRSNFVLIMEDRFHITPSTTGWLISFSAFVGVISGMLVGKIVSFYGSTSRLLLHCTVLLALTLLGLTFAPNISVVFAFSGVLSLSNAISRVCLLDLNVKRGRLDNTGALLGISQSIMSVSRSLAPIVSGFMLEVSQYGPALTGVCTVFAGTVLMIVIPPERPTVAAEKKTDDLFGVSMLLPLLPRHARDLGASPVWIGSVGSVYGVLQLISGPFMGRLSDVVGRRKILLLCLLMTALSYTMKVFATTFTILLISRFPLGIFKHGISTVKAFLAEITPQKQRPHVFGRFNAASTTGFIIGPLFGGYLSEYEGGFYRVATCTAAIFFLNLVFVYFVVHPSDSTTLERTKSVAAFTQDEFSLPTEANFFKSFKRIVELSSDLLLLRFLLGLSVMLFRDNFTLIMEERFHISPKINGWLISYGSLVAVLSGVVVGKIVAFYNNVAKLFLHATFLLIATLLGLTFAPNIAVVIFFMTLLSITNPVSRVCVTDLSIKRSDVSNTGAFLGISQSVASVSRSLSPFLGGIALEFGPMAPGLTGVSFAFVAVLLMMVIPTDRKVVKNKIV